MNFTEKKLYSKIRKPKIDIEKLLARGYLQRNRQIRKQPRIKPRLGMFGKSVSIKITRDEPVNPISKRIQARLNGDLGYLLEHGSSTSSSVNKFAKPNAVQQKPSQEKNHSTELFTNQIPVKNLPFQDERRKSHAIQENFNNFPGNNFFIIRKFKFLF